MSKASAVLPSVHMSAPDERRSRGGYRAKMAAALPNARENPVS
jgi:hypothetical protein